MHFKKAVELFKPDNEESKKEKQIFKEHIKTFSDNTTRKNNISHFTSSAFIVNKKRDKVLCVHHNIYKNWSLVGGHLDGNPDVLQVVKKEIKEETGLKNFKPIIESPISLDAVPSISYYSNNEYVPGHIHLSITFLFEADENQNIRILEEENSAVKWLTFEQLIEKSNEPHMIKIYEKILQKIKNLEII